MGRAPRCASCATQFARATGNAVDVQLDVNPEVVRRGKAGEAFDVAVGNPSTIEQLMAAGKVAAGSLADIGTAGLAVGVRAGAAKPDLVSVEAFKRALLAANAVAFPAHGASGLYFVGLVERLGLKSEMQGKLRPMPAEDCVEVVARGEADFVVVVATRMVGVAGIDVVGPIPRGLADQNRLCRRLERVDAAARHRQGADRLPQRAVGRRHAQGQRRRRRRTERAVGTRVRRKVYCLAATADAIMGRD